MLSCPGFENFLLCILQAMFVVVEDKFNVILDRFSFSALIREKLR